jgi:tetratricopeptide (TPR) repeat protein/transcriptional regulator with XRE-family HTH domain
VAVKRSRTFASLLKHHRDAAGLTQEELAGAAGLGERTISNHERGINRAPYRATVRRLADALGLSGEDLTQFAASARRPPRHSSSGGRMTVEGGFLGALPAAHLVAREQELGRILDAMEAVEGGWGRLVLLTGEPGIGKTRLAQEASVHAREGGFVVATGRCYEAQSGVPFYPFLEALGTLYEDALPKVRKEIPERWPYLARLLPDQFPLAASGDREEAQRLLRAVTGFVREVSARRPVALLLDDLHHADGASVDLLAHLCRHTRPDRVLLVGTYRDVEVGPEHALRKAVRELVRELLVEKVEVRRLGRKETAALMSDRLNGAEVPEEFSGLVFDHTGGNPFFTVEVLKSLIERGDLILREGRWFRKDMQDLAAPESVSEAILERVSRLQPQTRQALEEASVLGQVFGFEDLMAVVGLGEDDAEEALEEAEGSGLIWAAKVRYAFDHALTQQTLYAGLSPARRKRLHRAAGEGMERLGEKVRQKRAAEISRHFAQGSSPERALPYALLAGEEAEAAFAPGEAERQYRAALDLADETGDEPSAAVALEKLGGLLATTVRYDEALVALERTSDIHRARKNPEGASRVEARIAHAHFRQGTQDEGAARLSAYLTSLDKPDASEGARRAMAALYCALARLYLTRRRVAESLDAARRAASLSREVEAIGLLADAEMARGTALLWLDAPDEGVKALEEAVLLAEDFGALDALGTALTVLHLAYMVRGDFVRSREHAEWGAAIAKKTGDTDLLAFHTANFGLHLFYLGDWREAQGYLELAVELERSTQPSFLSSQPHAYLGVLYKARGAWEDASRCFSDAIALAREADATGQLGYAECRLAEMDVLQGRPTEAIARLQPRTPDLQWLYDVLLLSILAEAYADMGDAAKAEEVVDIAQTRARLMHNRVDGLEASRVRAKILTMQGNRKEASAALEEALSWARSMPYPYAEAKLSREYGMLHLREGEPGRAWERLHAALEVFRRLGAKKDAEQTRRTLQGLGPA